LKPYSKLGLEQVSTRNVSALSAGERQLCIAFPSPCRNAPKCMLLDEPTSNPTPATPPALSVFSRMWLPLV
jgi:ABC-type cobalamin/Fe3+-siderophores transport system ATPase subunit